MDGHGLGLAFEVIAEFMQFDVGSSETAGGLRPRYDSLLSFGPFEALKT